MTLQGVDFLASHIRKCLRVKPVIRLMHACFSALFPSFSLSSHVRCYSHTAFSIEFPADFLPITKSWAAFNHRVYWTVCGDAQECNDLGGGKAVKAGLFMKCLKEIYHSRGFSKIDAQSKEMLTRGTSCRGFSTAASVKHSFHLVLHPLGDLLIIHINIFYSMSGVCCVLFFF